MNSLYPSGFQPLPNGDSNFSCFVNFDSSWLVVPNGTNGLITRDSQGRPIPGTIKRVERLVNDRLIVDAKAVLTKSALKIIDANSQSYVEYLKERHEAGMCVLSRLFPRILVGTYLSAFYVVPTQHLVTPYFGDTLNKNNFISYPAPMLTKEFFKEDELLDPEIFQYYLEDKDGKIQEFSRYRVAFEKSTVTANKLIRLTVEEAKNRKASLLYLDNVTYFPGSSSYPTWAETCAYLDKLRNELYGEGIRLFINLSWYVGRQSDNKKELDDVNLLANTVEGVTFESGQVLYSENSLQPNEKMPFRENKEALEQNLKVFQRMLEQGLTVIFMPGKFLNQDATAAWALMIRKPGDRIFVSKNAHAEIPGWISWPEKLGIPIDPVGIVSSPNGKEVTVSRKFENSTISLNLATMEVKFTPKIF